MSFLGSLLFWSAVWLISHLLREKPEDPEAKEHEAFNYPTCKEGTSVPLIWGNCRVKAPNVIWYGPELHLPPADDPDDTPVYVGIMQLAIGLPMMVGLQVDPPGAILRTVWFAEKALWDGEVTDTEIFINEPDVYHGYVKFHQGTFLQLQDARLVAYFDDALSGLDSTLLPPQRGVVYAVLDGGWGDRPTPPAISFEVESITDPLGLGAVGVVGTTPEGDANPAEVIYDILVNPWGRLGLPVARVDATSFTAVGTVLASEYHGFSMVKYGSEDAKDVITEILKEIDGVLYEDIATQKIVLKLIRADYVIGALDVYDESSIERVEDYAAMLWSETYNQVRIDYTLRADNYTTRSVFAQDMANMSMQNGRKRSQEIAYPGINTKGIAKVVVARELKALSLPLAKVTLVANRDATELRPGDVFKFSWSEYNIVEMVLRVVRFDLGTLGNNEVKIVCMEDRFATDIAIFDTDDIPDTTVAPQPDPAEDQHVFEVPRWLGIRATQVDEAVNDAASRLWWLANKPDYATLFDGEDSLNDGVSYDTDKRDMWFVDHAEVETLYSKLAEPYDETVGFRIDTLSDYLTLETATVWQIQNHGKNLILVDDEFMAFENFTDEGGGVYTLEDVWRGLLDTVPAEHSVNASVYFVLSSDFVPMGNAIFDGDEALKLRLITKNLLRTLKDTLAPTEDLQLEARATLPVRPQQFRMTQSLYGSLGTNDPGLITENQAAVAWNRRERDRVIINRGDDLDDAETGTVYDVDCKVERDAAWTELDADVNADAVDTEFQSMGHGPAQVRVVAEDAAALEQFQDPTINFQLTRYRQLLLNPSFNDDDGAGGVDHWSVDAGAVAATASNPLDAEGWSAYGAAGGWTLSQTIEIDKFNPVGLYARLRFYAYGGDATDSVTITLAALESDDTPIGSVTTGSFSPTTTWESHDLAYGLPALTGKLKVTIVTVNGIGSGSNLQQFDEFDLRIGDDTDELLLNPQFNVNTASWVVASGAWTVGGPGFEGANALRCTSGAGSYEIYQEASLPIGFQDRGTAWFRGWAAAFGGTDTVEFVLEARDAGGVLASTTTGALLYAADSKWRDSDLFLDLPDDTDRLRLRVLYVHAGLGSMRFDDFRLNMFKELHPDQYDETSAFSVPTVQTWPDTRREWEAFSSYLPWAIWNFDESSGTEFVDTLNYNGDDLWHLLKVDTPDLAEILAGFYDGTDLANKLCFETEAGNQQGGELHALNQLSIDGGNSFAVMLVFRAHDVASGWLPLMGSMDTAQGWTVELRDSGELRANVKSDAPISTTLTLTEDHSGAVPHYVVFQYDATLGKFRIWSDRQSIAAVVVPATGDMTNLAKAIIGCDPTNNSADAQFGQGVLWIDDDAEDLSPTETNLWWNHAQDPSGDLDGYDPDDIIAGDVDSDADGIVVGRFSQEQVPLLKNTLLTAGKGLSLHKAQTNLVDPDPNSAAWVSEGAPVITKRSGPDAERFHRAVKISSDNADAYRPPAIVLGAQDVTVVWYARADASHLCTLTMWDSAKAVSISQNFLALGTWSRFEHTFAWAGATADFELWFHASTTGAVLDFELSTPIGVYAQSHAPFEIHPRTGAMAAVSGALSNVLPATFNEEGEISVTGICEYATPTGIKLIDITNGTNNNDRRFLEADGASQARFAHYDGAGASQVHVIAGAWTAEWVFRGRWNFGRLLEDVTKFTGDHYNATDVYGRVATFSVTAVVLDEIDLGAIGGLVSEIRLTSRELPL